MREIPKYSGCFVCGDQNEIGLKAVFEYDGSVARTKVTARRMFEGYKDIFHGGILSTLLDEVMIKAILAEDILAVTAELTVKFKAPVPIGETLTFTGQITERRRRLFLTEGEAVGRDGTIYATATGKYIEARPELGAQLRTSLQPE
jgi:uncharacterized protein (TIGR00369 family)